MCNALVNDIVKTTQVVFGLILYSSEALSVAVLAPFFPVEARKLGLSSLFIGAIMAAFDYALLTFTILLMGIVSSENLKLFYFFGPIISGVGNISFGIAYYGPPFWMFGILSLICRLFSGCGGAMHSSTAYSMLSYAIPNNKAKITSLLESSYGLGLILGPIIGSFLFIMGGYAFVFVFLGAFQILICFCNIPLIKNTMISSELEVKSSATFYAKYIFRPYIFAITIIMVMIASADGIMDTVLSPYLTDKFNVDYSVIGYIFLFASLCYTCACFIAGFFLSRGNAVVLFMSSIILVTIGFVVLFIPYCIPSLENPYQISFSLGILSIGQACCFVPSYALIEDISSEYDLNTLSQRQFLSTFTNIFSYSLGGVLGPLVFGGYVYDTLGFYIASLHQAGLMTICFVLGIGVFCSLRHRKKAYLCSDVNNVENSLLIKKPGFSLKRTM